MTLALLILPLLQLGTPPVPPQNPITEPKRILGKILFWDEQLSSDDSVACGTCHVPSAGGGDPRAGLPASRHPGTLGGFGGDDDKFGAPGIVRSSARNDYVPDPDFGFAPQVTFRNSQSNLTAAWSTANFWDGRALGEFTDPETGLVSIPVGGALESQAVEPILSSVEMSRPGRTWDDVRAKLAGARPLAVAASLTDDIEAALAARPTYPLLFEDAFGDATINAERIAYALATYQRTLVPDKTPYDIFIAGDFDALTQNQQDGLSDFQSAEQRCVECHLPPLFADDTFRNLGLRPISEDEGLSAVTGDSANRGQFKVPSLRNVGLRKRFFHNGDPNIPTLFDAVRFYDNSGGEFNLNEDPLMSGLDVPLDVAERITDFLQNGLTDPRVAAELPPFDRPRLNSERVRPIPRILDLGQRAGSGGFVPQPVATSPPALGSPDFRIGVSQGLGGARALLVVHPGLPSFEGGVRTPVGQPVVRRLAGSGAGQGHATFAAPVSSDPSLAGVQLWLQWHVRDPGAAGGFARSAVVRTTFL